MVLQVWWSGIGRGVVLSWSLTGSNLVGDIKKVSWAVGVDGPKWVVDQPWGGLGLAWCWALTCFGPSGFYFWVFSSSLNGIKGKRVSNLRG